MIRKIQHPTIPRQSGNVLLVCLALMFIMTLWGVSSTRNSVTSLQANYNARLSHIAFEAAEFAIRQAETMLDTQVTRSQQIPDLFDGTNGRYSLTFDYKQQIELALLPPDFNYQNANHWLEAHNSDGEYIHELSFIEVEYDADPDSKTRMDRQPRVIIEFMGRDGKGDEARYMFRLTAIGWGLLGQASKVIRSHYALAL